LEVVHADRAMGDVHPLGNPHYWLDPENGRAMARGIAQRLEALDPDGKATYEANLASFEKTLSEHEATWAKQLAPLAGQPLITFHKSWLYFAERYKIDVVGYVEPKPGIQPTAEHTVEVIQIARAKNVKAILMENYYDRRSPDQVAAHSNAKVVVVPSMVGGDAKIQTYIDLFDNIANELSKAVAG
jgi:ABC-type Zn uptake system ZnuABC Zn-binding protein ZnuA